MKNKRKILLTFLIAYFLGGCSSGASEDEPTPEPPIVPKIPISLNCTVSANTRVSDTGFDKDDQIGLYVVNYNGSTPEALLPSGNVVDNMRFTYNEKWTPASAIYWKDDVTPADFYCYYPYAIPTDITAHAFSLKTDQSTLTDYKASEFLYGKTTNVSPTENAVNITIIHLFSCAIVKVVPGNGFTEESLAASNISVMLNGCKTHASINLKDGSVTATGETGSISPLKEEKHYKALVVPQTVQADNFITVTVDGREFNLKKEFTFVGGKRHPFTVTVSKTSNGINVGIGAWEDDNVDNGGTAE